MAQLPLSYVFRHLTTGEGLASNKVSGIIRDKRGFMWISTPNGLQLYDGYSFTTWHHNPSDTNSLPTDGSICLLEDRDKNIWLSSWPFGFSIFNRVTGKCRRIYDRSLIDASGACLDKDGNVWLIASHALEEYDRRSQRLVSFKQLLPADIGFTRSIVYDSSSDRLYINSGRYGICVFDRSKNEFYYPVAQPAASSLAGSG